VILTNSVHYKRLQFEYEHAEFPGVDETTPLRRCDCPDPVYFPTPPPAGATPIGPTANRSDTLRLGFYRTAGNLPVTLRFGAAWTGQQVVTTVTSSQHASERRRGLDQSITLDTDTHFSSHGINIWGTAFVAHAWSSDMPAGDRAQNEFGYTYRLPAFPVGPVFVLGKVTVGRITGSGGTGVNLINPYVAIIWRHAPTKVTVRAMWSGESMRSRLEGWHRNDQLAVVLNRTVVVKMFNRTPRPSEPTEAGPFE
jgi:hypothetical protein